MAATDPARLLARYGQAKARRGRWESLWQDCYDYALPYRGDFLHGHGPGDRRGDRLFDGTAPDAVDQLAASLLAQLTPPWSRWIGFAPGPELDGPGLDGPALDEADRAAERDLAAPILERMAETLQSHLDRSNFAVEMHQCFLDLVVSGSASLLVEEAPPGEFAALRFTAVPLTETVLEEGPSGRLDVTFRRSLLTLAGLDDRFPGLALPADARRQGTEDPQTPFALIEAVLPEPSGEGGGFRYSLVLEPGPGGGGPTLLAEARFHDSPYINFRWLKAPGESYGRSPVMKALPDIKTANKVVELVLKNASIAVTGIWQADDDGVLNPAAVRLAPGTIIPKAVGSSGLTPLAAPGKFDVSELVLQDLRARIRRALLADRLGQIDAPRMTATEVLERASEVARLLGATYGRLQAELLTPLVLRSLAILRRRGEVPDLVIDGRLITLQYRSPLAQAQARRDVQTTLGWIETAAALGPGALAAIDQAAAVRWLGKRFGVPGELIRPPPRDPPAAAETPAAETPAGVSPLPDGAALAEGLTATLEALSE